MRYILVILGLLLSTQLFSQIENKYFNIELAYLNQQYDSVINLSNQILTKDSLDWKPNYYLGKAYLAKNKYFKALDQFEKALDKDSANRLAEISLAELYDFIGDDEKAIGIYYNQYLRDSTVLDPIEKLANIFRKKREYGSAIYYYQKAVEIDPDNFFYYKQVAYCFDKINMVDGAILSYQIALQKNPYDVSSYIQLANILNTERDFQSAIKTCEHGLNYFDQNAQLLKLKAYAYYLNKDFDSSIVGFNQLLEIGDTSYFNLKYRGLSYFEKKLFINAINDLSYAYKLNKNDAELCFYLGSAMGRSNMNEKGLEYLNKSLRLLSPVPKELANIYSEIANVYKNQKDYERSLEYLKMAYKQNATPMLSFKMAQLYDYYLDNKKLAINYYDGYLTMSNEPDTLKNDLSVVIQNSFTRDSAIIKNAKDRIRTLNEELFFEQTKKE